MQSILRYQYSSLSFLYYLAQSSQTSSKDEVLSWKAVSKEFGKFKTISQPLIAKSNSQDSIKNLFDSRDKRKYSTNCQSLATRVHSQSTTISSVTWSRNDIPTSSKLSSRYIYYETMLSSHFIAFDSVNCFNNSFCYLKET